MVPQPRTRVYMGVMAMNGYSTFLRVRTSIIRCNLRSYSEHSLFWGCGEESLLPLKGMQSAYFKPHQQSKK